MIIRRFCDLLEDSINARSGFECALLEVEGEAVHVELKEVGGKGRQLAWRIALSELRQSNLTVWEIAKRTTDDLVREFARE